MENQENKICLGCGGRVIFSTTPKELVDGLCPECFKKTGYMRRDNLERIAENKKRYDKTFPEKVNSQIS